MFRFKEFVIQQDKCAMKVGTDGVLLGAWVSCKKAEKILDIGTGTGLISLMLAQRNQFAKITAVEIDQDATKQAKENFKNSNWQNRLSVENCSIQEFEKLNLSHQFDLIVSNPPFFEVDNFKTNTNRKNARQEKSLTLQELFGCAHNLLTQNGTFALVFPSERERDLLEIAAHYQFFFKRKRFVRGNNQTPIKRLLIEFCKTRVEVPITENLLTLEPEKRHQYSEDYKQLTKDFYLKF